MKLWRIYRSDFGGYDTYSDAVVAAETEEAARLIHPSETSDNTYNPDREEWGEWLPDKAYGGKRWSAGWDNGGWVPVHMVQVEYLGEAKDGIKVGVVCASYRAG